MLSMKLRKLAAMLVAAAMMITLMPAMAFANGDQSEQPPAAQNLRWGLNGSGAIAEWDPVVVPSGYDFSAYLLKAYWKSSDSSSQVACTADFFDSGELTSDGYWPMHGVGNTEWSVVDPSDLEADFLRKYGPGKYQFEVTAEYRKNNAEVRAESSYSAWTQFGGAKIVVNSLNDDGTPSKDQGCEVMFSIGDGSKQFNKIESESYVTLPVDAKIVLESYPDMGYRFVNYTYGDPVETKSERKISYTITDSDGITVTVKDSEKVPLTIVFGKGHEDLAIAFSSYINEKTRFSCTLKNKNTEVVIQWPIATNVGDAYDFINDCLTEEGVKEFLDNGEERYAETVGVKPLQDYKDEQELEDEQDQSESMPVTSDGLKVFVHWAIPARNGAFTVKEPICGTKITLEQLSPLGGAAEPFAYYKQQPVPEVTDEREGDFLVQGAASSGLDFGPKWLKDKNIRYTFEFLLKDKLFEGTIMGGQSYTAGFFIYPKFGYYLDAEIPHGQDPVPLEPDDQIPAPMDPLHGQKIDDLPAVNADITVNGKQVKAFYIYSSGQAYLSADVTADHDWGPWTVTKEPTTSEDGEETRTCKGCGAKETRAIPKLPVKQKKPLMATVRTKGKKSVRLSWNVMEDADGYDIFFARCNTKKKKYTCKYAGSVRGAKSTSWTKSSLKKGIPYKMYVKAYVIKDGKKSYFAKSPTVHAFASGSSKKYTNPKSVRVKKASAAIKAGKTYKIKASVVKLKKNKTLINTGHAPKLRYLSTDTSVATVSKSGKVKGKTAGSCKIYVYAVNGMKKAVKITVS